MAITEPMTATGIIYAVTVVLRELDKKLRKILGLGGKIPMPLFLFILIFHSTHCVHSFHPIHTIYSSRRHSPRGSSLHLLIAGQLSGGKTSLGDMPSRESNSGMQFSDFFLNFIFLQAVIWRRGTTGCSVARTAPCWTGWPSCRSGS